MADKTVFKKRKFLNKNGYYSMAAICASIDISTWKNSEGGVVTSIYPEISIADCSRKITLDFDINTKGSRKNSFYKLNLLIDTLTEMRDKLEEVCEEHYPK